MKKQIHNLLLLSIVYILTACGSNGSGAPASTTSLTETQRNAVSEALIYSSLDSSLGFLFTLKESQDYDETSDCPESGTYTIKGTVEYDTGENEDEAKGKYTLTQSFEDCELLSSTDEQIILNGSLELKTDLDLFSQTDGEDSYLAGTVENNFKGGLDITGADVEEGVCGFNLDSRSVITDFFGTVEFSGELCGEDYVRFFPLGG